MCRIGRHISPMTIHLDEVVARIDQRLKAVKLTQRAASMRATGQPDMIRYMRSRGVVPGIEKMMRLADVLDVPVSWLMDGGQDSGTAAQPRRAGGIAIPIHGTVHHLSFQEAFRLMEHIRDALLNAP